jgi:4-aminobutyrate aminotransferase-like enzyme/Ser/Thr protein kinase RdoA (MazF antagonist)
MKERELTVGGRPSYSAEEAGELVRAHYGIEGSLEPLPAEWDQNFRIDAGEQGAFVIKIANTARSAEELDFQNAVMSLLSECWSSGKSPRAIKALSGERIIPVSGSGGASFLMRALTWLPGKPMALVSSLDKSTVVHIGRSLGELDACLFDFEHPAMDRDFRWDLRQADWISSQTGHISDIRKRGIVERLFLQYRARVSPMLSELPISVIHNDANDENILLEPDGEGGWKIAGLLDFGDMLKTYTVGELAVTCAYAILRSDDALEMIWHMASGYHDVRPLSPQELAVLFPMICMRLCISVTTSAIAAAEDPHNEHRQISDSLAWKALEQLERIDWHDAETGIHSACGLEKRREEQFGRGSWSYEKLLDERHRRIGPSLSLSYETPLEIVRGSGQFLFERGGRAYLDCVNNICHVGHSHPRVVAALSSQAGILNTNTRYLHPGILEYAERLASTLPEPLGVCFFVNSGSEANELAVRMARTHTGRRDVIVLDGGYHGNTQTLIDLSPYKCEGPGGSGLPEWAHKGPKPDPYRGLYRGTGTGRAYAGHIEEMCDRLVAEGRPPALFLCEALQGCGGQIVPPENFLEEAFRHVRKAGGLCVVDEVQVGMGRVGSHMWAFETQGVVPDIVTMGKPIGNGHPLGAVVTTPEIARSFANGMEFFSSFGGNPVSMAVGMAVLDVIEEEGLLERALRVGSYLRQGFLALADRHPLIGDVRGLGLFVGVELVTDREERSPAIGETARLIERLKEDGILLSADGPDLNVFKIKPPMQFEEIDADLLLGAVDRALAGMGFPAGGK